MLYKSKLEFIKQYVVNKTVLDLGCVTHNIEEADKEYWLHKNIKNEAKSVVGIDYLENEVKQLQHKGYHVVCADVETMELGELFQTIVAGDIVEHLSNHGLFLERVNKHLEPGSMFVLTTPNPINILRFINVLVKGRAGANAEHTCWFTSEVLEQLASRYGLSINEIAYVDDSYEYYNKYKWWPFLILNYILCRIRHGLSETICMSFTKISDTE